MLKFIRVAVKNKDASDGLLYLHHFGTGCQELIFHSKDHADSFAKAEGIEAKHAD